ncbi:MAG: protein kinase, partial [Anaerolineae bacterium]|nr:protein kinase [Anaerolineae bacterium]
GLPFRPVLTDLGLAKLAEGGMVTLEGTSMGTPAYMSPEQAFGEKTDARSDVYSLGVLLYELAVGRLPFPVRTLTEAIRYHTKEPPPPPRSLRPDMPEALEEVILKALEKDAAARFADAGAMAEALARALPVAPPGATIVTGMPTVAPAAPGATIAEVAPAVPRLAAQILPNELVVDAGSSTTAAVVVTNQGAAIARLRLSVTGLPPAWIPAMPAPVQLGPGAQQRIVLMIQPPRTPQTRAGAYPFSVHVTSEEAPGQVAEAGARLTVRPYLQWRSELKPEVLGPGRPGQVRVENQGNAPQTFHVGWDDPSGQLTFTPPEADLVLPEGQGGAVTFRVAPRARPLFGGRKAFPFSARITGPGGEAQAPRGELVAGGRVAFWVPALAAVALVALVAVVALAMGRPPVVQSVAVEPANPLPGQPVTVRWAVRNAQSVELRPLVAGLDPSLGAYTFAGGFSERTSLTFVARGRFGSSEQPLAIAVVAPLPVAEPTEKPTPAATSEPTAEPSSAPATAEPTLTPTPEPTPTASPTPCPALSGPFAAVYEHWRPRLGCAAAPAGTSFMAFAPFERGCMFWRQDTREIYVLVAASGSTKWYKYPDTWEEG